MGTLVCFHAHPDDESIATGGTMARAAAEGHRVVLVTATRGELGEIMPGVLEPGEQLGLRRTAELYASAEALGVQRVEVLGYVDSGMMGEPGNDVPWSFWQADVDRAARRLADVLVEERPDVLTIYDDNGGYGHPDHIQVHRVGRRAAELAGVHGVYESTINRDHILRLMTSQRNAAEAGLPEPPAVPDGSSADGLPLGDFEMPDDFGVSESRITHAADVTGFVRAKRASMRCHPSQMAPDHFMLAMSDEQFAVALGTEWYIGPPPGTPGAELGDFADILRPYHPPT